MWPNFFENIFLSIMWEVSKIKIAKARFLYSKENLKTIEDSLIESCLGGGGGGGGIDTPIFTPKILSF